MHPCHSPKELRSVKNVCTSSGSDSRNTASEMKRSCLLENHAKHSYCWNRYFQLKQIDTFNKAVQASSQQINLREFARQLDPPEIILMEIAHY